MNHLYCVDVVELRKMMIDKGVNTIKDLSDKSGVDRNTLSKILKGEIRPSATAMDGISMALQMSSETTGKIFFANNLRIKKEMEAVV